MSTGHLHINGFDSLPAKKEEMPKGISSFLEQGTGIEPASEAWEATIIADIRTLRYVWVL